MRMPSASRRALRAFATFVLVTTFAGDMWRNSLSWWGFSAIALAVLVASITLLVRSRPLPRAPRSRPPSSRCGRRPTARRPPWTRTSSA